MREASGEARAARFTFDAICAPRANRAWVRNRVRLGLHLRRDVCASGLVLTGWPYPYPYPYPYSYPYPYLYPYPYPSP